MLKEKLGQAIDQRKAKIGVIGLGYVGLPLIVEFCLKGFDGIGFEVDENKAKQVNEGISYIVDVPSENLNKCVEAGHLVATTDFSRLTECDVIVICVPTPLRKTKDPDMSFILSAGEEIQKYMRKGQLVLLESTTYPGTTDEVLLPMLEAKGFKLDEDFLLGFSPERVDPGNPQFQTHNITKVVGGVSSASTEVAAKLYGTIVDSVHPVSSARVAEACKLWENTFRAINIGMANEMARLCNALGIDTWEVVRAAATKPFGFMPFYPGPGIGGHCIPLDPHYLSWKARQHGFDSQFISLAEQVNSSMPRYVAGLVRDALNEKEKSVKGANILILGVAYKKDIDDMRESPALSIIDLLRSRGANVYYHDPFVPEVTFDHSYTIGDGEPLFSRELTDELIRETDCVVICTDHTDVDYGRVCDISSLIVDTRNALSEDFRKQSSATIIRL
ncbi:nucleotide sugar dehydrogenase [Leptolyngbya sp. 7M]|uniref:nucleotide sugar dehydrogenase n=1 Tax=Leptolyngbya sp. 7M TaxID=2812896 RepID=UPI001B8DA580|nr:nucleotide sugar dehydrogenase [Leptolyngbya sp. 7M]QYO66216.1 nucleotide sugar dehydrogenase [Leptolyngbya sp. 7M]